MRRDLEHYPERFELRLTSDDRRRLERLSKRLQMTGSQAIRALIREAEPNEKKVDRRA